MKELMNLCFIDDDPIYQYMIKRMVGKDQLANKLWTFTDAEEAIAYLIAHCTEPENMPDIIFLDINMSIMDGWQFLSEFNTIKTRLNKLIKVYIVTSSTDPKDIEQAKEFEEVADYLVKPLNPDKLKDLLIELKAQS